MNRYVISRTDGVPDWSKIQALDVAELLWLPDAGIRMKQAICYDGSALYVRQTAVENRIRAEHHGAGCPVCEDSCMEFFFSLRPENGRYFNFEINPNGAFFLGLGHGREDLTRLFPEASLFDIHTARTPGGWEVTYQLPLTFLREYYPGYTFAPGLKIRANCYKCGDLTDAPHYLAWNRVACAQPDFHRPEYFGEMYFE